MEAVESVACVPKAPDIETAENSSPCDKPPAANEDACEGSAECKPLTLRAELETPCADATETDAGPAADVYWRNTEESEARSEERGTLLSPCRELDRAEVKLDLERLREGRETLPWLCSARDAGIRECCTCPLGAVQRSNEARTSRVPDADAKSVSFFTF
jgi:hypothetical protein